MYQDIYGHNVYCLCLLANIHLTGRLLGSNSFLQVYGSINIFTEI